MTIPSASERRKHPDHVLGVNLQRELKRLHATVHHLGPMPELNVRHSDTGSVRGTAYTQGCAINLTVGPSADMSHLLGWLLTLMLLAMGRRSDFGSRAAFAAHLLWGLQLNHMHRMNSQHKSLILALTGKSHNRPAGESVITTFGCTPAEPPTPKAQLPRYAKLAIKVNQREARARRMLAKHQLQLARTQRLVKKWSAAVAYYDRKLATKKPVDTEQINSLLNVGDPS